MSCNYRIERQPTLLVGNAERSLLKCLARRFLRRVLQYEYPRPGTRRVTRRGELSPYAETGQVIGVWCGSAVMTGRGTQSL